MIARASSGSRSCSSWVEPLMSADSALTVLHSPSIEEASACSAAKRIAGAETGTAEFYLSPQECLVARGAFSAEFRGRSVFEAASAASPSKWRGAFVTELEARRIFRPAF